MRCPLVMCRHSISGVRQMFPHETQGLYSAPTRAVSPMREAMRELHEGHLYVCQAVSAMTLDLRLDLHRFSFLLSSCASPRPIRSEHKEFAPGAGAQRLYRTS